MSNYRVSCGLDWITETPFACAVSSLGHPLTLYPSLFSVSMFDCLVGLFMAFGSVATTIAVLPVVIAVLPPLLWYFVSMRQIFVATTRELK